MTDAALYTGTHKERFDESGKGRGMEGRSFAPKGKGAQPGNISQEQGYVIGYKNEGTYGHHSSSAHKSPKVAKVIKLNL